MAHPENDFENTPIDRDGKPGPRLLAAINRILKSSGGTTLRQGEDSTWQLRPARCPHLPTLLHRARGVCGASATRSLNVPTSGNWAATNKTKHNGNKKTGMAPHLWSSSGTDCSSPVDLDFLDGPTTSWDPCRLAFHRKILRTALSGWNFFRLPSAAGQRTARVSTSAVGVGDRYRLRRLVGARALSLRLCATPRNTATNRRSVPA